MYDNDTTDYKREDSFIHCDFAWEGILTIEDMWFDPASHCYPNYRTLVCIEQDDGFGNLCAGSTPDNFTFHWLSGTGY